MAVYIGGVIQDVDPHSGSCAVAEVKTGNTYYAGAVAVKTGSGTQTLSAASEVVAAGYYAATTLSTVDTDLTAANIATGEVIFGITGEAAGGTQAEDTTGEDSTATNADATDTAGYNAIAIAGTTEVTLATKTLTYDADSITVAVGFAAGLSSDLNKMKLRLYLGGTLVTTSGYIPTTIDTMIIVGTRALSGSQECKIVCYNEDSSEHTLYAYSEDSGSVLPFGIGCGSIKLT